jgi:hypothetical protein
MTGAPNSLETSQMILPLEYRGYQWYTSRCRGFGRSCMCQVFVSELCQTFSVPAEQVATDIMKLATLLCWTVSATWLVPTADATIIQLLLYRFLSRLFLDVSCQSTLRTLGDFDRCSCQLDNRLSGTSSADFDCSIGLAQCLVEPNLFCIEGDYEGQVEFGILPFVGLSSSVKGCYNFNSGPPIELSDFGAFREICLEVDPRTGSRVASCSVTIGEQQCSECDVCDSGQGITFSCANVDIGGSYPAFVAGPVVSKCIDLNLAPR